MGQAQPDFSTIFHNHSSQWPTEADLPPRRHAHWLRRQKKIVVLAVQTGLLPLHEAMERYELSIEEFQSWNREFNMYPYRNALRDYRAGKFGSVGAN